jgi:hypothetical protein
MLNGSSWPVSEVRERLLWSSLIYAFRDAPTNDRSWAI